KALKYFSAFLFFSLCENYAIKLQVYPFKMQIRNDFLLIFKFACKWAVRKKSLVLIKIKIYLFGSYLRFKSRF
ncbi:hypothetical protein DBN75_13060, partial [Enterococcus faecalis]|nr:hypothetical protein [Enterococcus faecalis]NRE26696.1 hypothetical protein [Enterococcus faecalis]NRE38489.1 hypothetical protein [Enterococcus faecalis]